MTAAAPFSVVQKSVYRLLDVVFPPRCAGCGRLDCLWCDACAERVNQVRHFQHTADVPPLAAVFSMMPHAAPLQEAVQRLKYESDGWQAAGLAEALFASLGTVGEALADFVLVASIQAIVPVPLHRERLKWRGYNQAELISHNLADRLNLLHLPNALTRQKDTGQQVGRTADERQAAMQGAFAADTAQIDGKRVLLVDDVLTTGATLSACAESLLENGAQAIYAFTLTRA